jgi:seryl-tRNA synthetase
VYETQDAYALTPEEYSNEDYKKTVRAELAGNKTIDANGKEVNGSFTVSKTPVREGFEAPDINTDNFTSYEKLQRNIVMSKKEEKALEKELEQINQKINSIEEEGISNGEEEIANLEQAKKLKMEMLK